MTPDMSFECLLISRDPAVLSVIHPILGGLSIDTKICFHPLRAVDMLAEASTDLFVIDLADKSSADIVAKIWKSGPKPKPTVVGISTTEDPIPGVHVTVKKPITAETASQSLKHAYSRMLRDYRRHTRCAVLIPVTAMDGRGIASPLTVVDVGYGGVGLRLKREADIGEELSFHLLLPGMKRAIYIQARVVWTRSFGTTGCEFLRVPPVDLNILHNWLAQKIRVKKPSVQV
jgi:hypothetical protein